MEQLAILNPENGGVAQLGEHLPCTQGVRSSILLISTMQRNLQKGIGNDDKPIANQMGA